MHKTKDDKKIMTIFKIIIFLIIISLSINLISYFSDEAMNKKINGFIEGNSFSKYSGDSVYLDEYSLVSIDKIPKFKQIVENIKDDCMLLFSFKNKNYNHFSLNASLKLKCDESDIDQRVSVGYNLDDEKTIFDFVEPFSLFYSKEHDLFLMSNNLIEKYSTEDFNKIISENPVSDIFIGFEKNINETINKINKKTENSNSWKQ